MKRSKFFLVLLVVLSPLFINAQTQNVEFGLQAGAGLFMGVENPVPGYTRISEFAWMRDSEDIPAFETYGALIRYRFDTRWALQLQGMRQRTRFKEVSRMHEDGLYFYNAMWNIDLMAEYNILKYGFFVNRNANIYTITPYVAIGLGASLYNKHATYRWGLNEGAKNTPYPMIKAEDLAVAMYIPMAVGMKLRMAANWQLKVAFQYNLYVMNGDVCGSTVNTDGYPNGGGVDLAKVQYNVASTHNVAATVGIIYNLPANDQGGAIITY